MNDLYNDNGNYPPGYEEKGIKIRFSGPANWMDQDRKFHEQLKGFPDTPDQADAMHWKILQSGKALDYENII